MLGRYCESAVPAVDVDPALAGDFEGLVEEVSALLDDAEITQALDRIWQRVRRLNRYVEEKAPWQLARDETKGEELRTTLRSLAEGLRVLTVLLAPYIPESADKLLAALGAPETDLAGARFGTHPGGQPVGTLAPLFPKPE
jgi:methionyl-tRNA synthetase